MLEWPDTADARPEDFEELIIEPFLGFCVGWDGSSDDGEDVASGVENMRVVSGLQNVLCDFEPFVVVFGVVGGTEEVVDLFIGELVCEDLVCDLIDGRNCELNPARVGEEFVEVFEVWFVDNEFFLGKKKGIDRSVEFLVKVAAGRVSVIWVVVGVVSLGIEFVEAFDDVLFREVFGDVFDAVDKDGAFGIVELFVAEGPDIALFIADKDGDILPECRGGNEMVASDDVARKTVYKGFVFAVVKKIVELV